MNGFFITGTDTGVGKTHVTCALAGRAVALGHKVFAFKPIESGCTAGPGGELVGADQEALVAAAGGWQEGARRGLYRFPLPAAPSVAGRAAGQEVDLDRVVDTARRAATEAHPSLVLVEGAGGWRVPITDEADMSTLARRLGLPVVIVARAGLGTINHSLLTIEAVQRDGLEVAAVLLSQRPEDSGEAALSNCAEIRRRWRGMVAVFTHEQLVLDELLVLALSVG